MTGFVLCIAMAVTAAADDPLSYNEAYTTANKTKKPMLILVGADWCPACRVMKHSTLPQLQRSGKLSGVAYTIVDVDESPRIGGQLMRSSSIPQLILCATMSDGWKRTYLHGNQAPEQILRMIQDGLEEQRQDFAAHKQQPAAAENQGQAGGE